MCRRCNGELTPESFDRAFKAGQKLADQVRERMDREAAERRQREADIREARRIMRIDK